MCLDGYTSSLTWASVVAASCTHDSLTVQSNTTYNIALIHAAQELNVAQERADDAVVTYSDTNHGMLDLENRSTTDDLKISCS